MAKYAIFYMKPEFFRDGILGYDWCEQQKKLPNPKNLGATHTHLMNVEKSNPVIEKVMEEIWISMQAERWSPNGEAVDLIQSKGLHHTSMSVGDIVVHVKTGIAFMVDRWGFRPLNQTSKQRKAAEKKLREQIADQIDGYDRDDLGESPDY